MGFDWCLSKINWSCQRVECIYVVKGYMSDGMWKLNVMTIIKSDMNKASTYVYIL